MIRLGISIFTAPEAGGAYQYTRSLLQAVSCFDKNEIEVIVYSPFAMWDGICRGFGLEFKHLVESKLRKIIYHMGYELMKVGSSNSFFYSFHPMWKAYKADNLDLMIVSSPTWYGKPKGARVIIPIFDIMHRYIDFEEVGGNGISQERDRRYIAICKDSDGILVDSKLGKKQVVESYGSSVANLEERVFSLPFIAPDYVLDAADCIINICQSQEYNSVSNSTNITRETIVQENVHGDTNYSFSFASDNGKSLNYKEICVGKKVDNLPDKFIFYPAQFWKHKNHVNLLRAIGELKKDSVEVNIVLTGGRKNAMEDIEKIIEEYKLTDQVYNMGYLDDDELVYIYQKARALVFASFGGPTNIPPLEAMALGCPVAVADNFAMPEQIGDAGLTFAPDSVEEIADVIRRLWIDDKLCQDLSQKGLARSRQWTVKEFSEGLLDIIMKVLS